MGFFPLLKHYPENPDVSSLADKTYFTIVNLDELNNQMTSPEFFVRQFMKPDSPDWSL